VLLTKAKNRIRFIRFIPLDGLLSQTNSALVSHADASRCSSSEMHNSARSWAEDAGKRQSLTEEGAPR